VDIAVSEVIGLRFFFRNIQTRCVAKFKNFVMFPQMVCAVTNEMQVFVNCHSGRNDTRTWKEKSGRTRSKSCLPL